MRDGWTLIEREKWSRWNSLDIFEKPLHAGWVLRKIAHAGADRPEGKGCYWDEHELIHPPSKACVKCPDWEWADLEGPRLVWVTRGKLCAGRFQKGGLLGETELADFNSMAFEPIEAPY
jgi:hypothetical protein